MKHLICILLVALLVWANISVCEAAIPKSPPLAVDIGSIDPGSYDALKLDDAAPLSVLERVPAGQVYDFDQCCVAIPAGLNYMRSDHGVESVRRWSGDGALPACRLVISDSGICDSLRWRPLIE